MKIKLETAENIKDASIQLIIVSSQKVLQSFLSPAELTLVKKKLENNDIFQFIQNGKNLIFIKDKEAKSISQKTEAWRRSGSEVADFISKEKCESIQLWGKGDESLALAEGIMLAGYRFEKYKSKPVFFPLKKIIFSGSSVSKENLQELSHLVQAVYYTRNLVNEPEVYLTAVKLGEELKHLGKEAGFEVEVFNKRKIESLKMGGLLAVNKGSIDPPAFAVLEYKPAKAINKQPYIIVGKGVVYDTGGLSLKDSDNMSIMKCDMAGAAAVAGAFYAVAKNKLPIYLVGLIPATDNRPGGNAIAPGDVITISNGMTVEVVNTDAEGRLILADALTFASKYKPKLVIDLATLTGAAARAIGRQGIVFMGNASDANKKSLQKSGEEVHERLVEFPLWEEYENQIKSDIADIKNLGDGDAGAITAGKFLEKFVDYEWLHLDIAGPAFLKAPDFYRTKNASGVGVRLLYNFFKSIN